MKRFRIRPGSIADYCVSTLGFMALLAGFYMLSVLVLCL